VNLPGRDISTWYEDAASVIRRAFQTNRENLPQFYNANFLAFCYTHPGALPELSPAFVRDDSLASVLVSHPRHVIFERKRPAPALLTLVLNFYASCGHDAKIESFAFFHLMQR
jgi:hypothetical protein